MSFLSNFKSVVFCASVISVLWPFSSLSHPHHLCFHQGEFRILTMASPSPLNILWHQDTTYCNHQCLVFISCTQQQRHYSFTKTELYSDWNVNDENFFSLVSYLVQLSLPRSFAGSDCWFWREDDPYPAVVQAAPAHTRSSDFKSLCLKWLTQDHT